MTFRLYRCPADGCGGLLDAQHSGNGHWLKCPRCGQFVRTKGGEPVIPLRDELDEARAKVRRMFERK